MIRLFVRASVTGVVLFAASITVITARPYQADALHELLDLSSSACSSPCMMGLQPGITSEAEARVMLSAHPWVGQVREANGQATSQSIGWQWSGQQPVAVDADGWWVIYTADGVVTTVSLSTTLSLADFILDMGPPEKEGMTSCGTYVAQYAGGSLMLESDSLTRPVREFWASPVRVRLADRRITYISSGRTLRSMQSNPVVC